VLCGALGCVVDPGFEALGGVLGEAVPGAVVLPGAGVLGLVDGEVPGVVFGFVEFGPELGLAGLVFGVAEPGAGAAVPGGGEAAPGAGVVPPAGGVDCPGAVLCPGDAVPGVPD